MKKSTILTLFLFLSLLFPTIVQSYVYCEQGNILFKTGSIPLITRSSTNEWGCHYEVIVEGDNLSTLKTERENNFNYTEKMIGLYPTKTFITSGYGQYGFWKIAGTYNGLPFLMAGMVWEGDFIENQMLPHLFFLILAVIIAVMAVVIVKKAKE